MNFLAKRNFKVIILLMLLMSVKIYSADLEVPNMELITRSNFDTGIPVLTTRGKIDLLVGGGYKLGGSLTVGFDSEDLGYSNTDPATLTDVPALGTYLSNQTYLQFQSAQIIIRDLFSSPTDLTYFIGKTDVLCSGDDFPNIFGSAPIATRYHGYLYFPKNEFHGIHTINGTGLKVSSNFGNDRNITSAYIYEDGYMGSGYFSSDLRTLFNFDKVKIESFLGATFPASSYGLYRAGFLFNYNSGTTGEFFAQIGVPQWDPSENFNMDRLLFLFEPRIKFNPLTIILTLFLHPGYYLQNTTSDSGSSDVHINFMIGEPGMSTFAGGIEGSATYNSSTPSSDQFSVKVSPYLSAITSGVIWNIMLNTKLLPYSLNDMFEGVISIKAEF